MPPDTSRRPPQLLSLAATANLAWSLAATAGLAFAALQWPRRPAATLAAPEEAAWTAWGAALAYIAATAALHLWMSVVARRCPERLSFFLCNLPAIGHAAVIVTGVWSLAAGFESLVLLAGLGSVTATAVVIGALSLPLAVFVSTAAQRTQLVKQKAPLARLISAVCTLAGMSLATALLLIELGVR